MGDPAGRVIPTDSGGPYATNMDRSLLLAILSTGTSSAAAQQSILAARSRRGSIQEPVRRDEAAWPAANMSKAPARDRVAQQIEVGDELACIAWARDDRGDRRMGKRELQRRRRERHRGRGLLFDKQYDQAANLLEQSVRIDPGEAYGYNALGIAYLEQADFGKAVPAFRDAARRAPNWSYPLHNLALAYVEAGDYQNAIRSYQQAMRLTPQFSYLPYNLGLVYQRLNQRREAETAYRRAMALAPDSAEPLNALGSLKASEGKTAEAEKFYRDALQKNPSLLAARHNLGILFAGLKGRQNEAVDAWKQNLAANPDYLASRLSLAELMSRTGDTTGAIGQYVYVVGAKPEYVAARLALAGLYLKSNQADRAVEQLRAAAQLDALNASIQEQIGDAEKSLNHRRRRAGSIRQRDEAPKREERPQAHSYENGFLKMTGAQVRLKLWGVRGSTPTPQIENLKFGGNTPCLEIRNGRTNA